MRIVTGALVIRHADYGDSNRMVTLITPKYGKIEAVARGCRRLKSPIVNAAELFTSGEYTLFERNGRYSIEQCQISESFFALRQDTTGWCTGSTGFGCWTRWCSPICRRRRFSPFPCGRWRI